MPAIKANPIIAVRRILTEERGDIIALLDTGSYIEPMAANFNALPRPGTILVCGDQAEQIKRPETVEDERVKLIDRAHTLTSTAIKVPNKPVMFSQKDNLTCCERFSTN